MAYAQNVNSLYGSNLVTLVRGMKLSIANQKVKEFITKFLELGYSKEELIEYINTYLEEEE